jgi:hypothetical protein
MISFENQPQGRFRSEDLFPAQICPMEMASRAPGLTSDAVSVNISSSRRVNVESCSEDCSLGLSAAMYRDLVTGVLV